MGAAHALSLLAESDMPEIHRGAMGPIVYADTYDDIVFVVDAFVGKFVELVASGDTSEEAIAAAWADL